MKILKLKIFNYLGITNFAVDKLGQLNRITGDNGLGKSSVVKAIREAFSSSGVDPELINIKGEKAEIIVRLDNDIEIFRTITQASNTAKVVVKGEPVGKSQTFLNSLLGPINFDPTAFFLLKDGPRVNLLLSAMPFRITADEIRELIDWTKELWNNSFFAESDIDYSKHGLIVLSNLQKIVYDRRHEVNLDLTRKKKAIEQDKKDLGETPKADTFKGFDLDKAVEELSKQREHNNSLANDKHTLESLREQDAAKQDEIERLEKQLKRAKAEKAEIVEKGKALVASIKDRGIYDTKALQDQISEYNRLQEVLIALKNIDKRQEELEEDIELHRGLDDLHKLLVNEVPKALLSKMELPVEGLEIKGDQIFINGININKMAASEQIDFAFEIATALAGELKLICMDGFESVVGNNRKKIIAKAEEKAKQGYQFFIAEAIEDAPLELTSENIESPKPAATRKRTAKAGNKSKAAF
jgi:exonuclease SbcC